MIVLRLFAAACLFSNHGVALASLRAAGDEKEALTTTSTIFVDAPAAAAATSTEQVAAAIAHAKALYETLEQEYIQEGCLETWGDFPLSLSSQPTNAKKIKGGNLCKCGLIYDLAIAHLVTSDDEEEALAKASSGGAVLPDPAKPMTRVESWVAERTPHRATPCTDGRAAIFECDHVHLFAHVPLVAFETSDPEIFNSTYEIFPESGNDLWGWTSRTTHREFVAWGIADGHLFLEVFPDAQPILLGYLPSTGGTKNLWHDVKILGDFCYMGSEAEGHGMQIFDMKKLLEVNPSTDCVDPGYCQVLEWDAIYTGNATYPISTSHNIVANEESNFVYIVGGSKGGCRGGLHVVDVSDPLHPQTAGCFGGDGFVHDAHCVNYKGPDPEFSQDNEICFCFNEDSLTIVDVTDKSDMKILSKLTNYDEPFYTHQGWLSTDHSHIVFGDEFDEYVGAVSKTRTLVVNVEDLRNPTNIQEYRGRTSAIDHNQYIVKAPGTDLIYQANYEAGLSILQVLDYETADFVEVGHFDIFPFDDKSRFLGAWSVFPYFPSGLVAIGGIHMGLFLVQPDLQGALIDPTTPAQFPTPKPTPTRVCPRTENPKRRFTLKGNGNVRTCASMESMTQKRAEQFCGRRVLRGNNSKRRVRNECPITCGKLGLGPCWFLEDQHKPEPKE